LIEVDEEQYAPAARPPGFFFFLSHEWRRGPDQVWWSGRRRKGYTATRRIKADPALRSIPIIAVTSLGSSHL